MSILINNTLNVTITCFYEARRTTEQGIALAGEFNEENRFDRLKICINLKPNI